MGWPATHSRKPIPGTFITTHGFRYCESQTEAEPVRRLYGLQDMNGAIYGVEKDRSCPEGLETEEFAQLQTVRTAYGVGRI